MCGTRIGAVIDGDARHVTADAHALLRQLAAGFGVHRLYPGAVEGEAFVTAATRIEETARAALRAGPVALEVHTGRFEIDGRVVDDPATRRLAYACYERRIEHVVLDDVPSREELGRWYDLLSRDPHDIEEAGGIAPLLAEAGVAAIRSAAGAPEAADGEEIADEVTAVLDDVDGDPAPTPEEIDALRLRPDDTADRLYERLRTLSDRLEGPVRTTLFRRAAGLVAALPPPEQARFGRLVIDRLADDGFAERYAGHLNDVALAMLLVTVARHEGGDPDALAREVGRMAGRHGTLLRLVAALVQGGSSPVAPSDPRDDAARQPAGAAPLGPTVATSGAATVAEEHRELAGGVPEGVADRRSLALTALVDVLAAGPRDEHTIALLDNVVDHLRDAVRAGDASAVSELLGALEHAATVAEQAVAVAIERAIDGALTGTVVAEAAVAHSRQGHPLEAAVLRPLGAAAIAPVVQALGADLADPVARRLATLLSDLVDGHHDVLHDEVTRQHPQVIARMLPLLVGAGDRELQTPLLSRLACRPELVVQRAVVDALAHQPPAAAAPELATLARRSTDAGVQRRCLDVLSRCGDPGIRALRELATGPGEPQLAFRLRWRARRLARTSGGR